MSISHLQLLSTPAGNTCAISLPIGKIAAGVTFYLFSDGFIVSPSGEKIPRGLCYGVSLQITSRKTNFFNKTSKLSSFLTLLYVK